jgi:hypothetical protein
MPIKQNSLQSALGRGRLKTRPIGEIEQDQEEVIGWAENVAKHFPVKFLRSRLAIPQGPAEKKPSR